MRSLLFAVAAGAVLATPVSAQPMRPLVDTHIHYSHDAWEMMPPAEAVNVLRKAGLKRAFVSSSSDEGTQKLYAVAPDLIVPVLRPYRKRGEIGTWFRDDTVLTMLSDLLDRNTYAGIGEFHIFGDDANSPVMRGVVELAKKHKIFLHAHSDAAAVDNIMAQDPDARVLWAHSGFAPPETVMKMLAKYPNLKADLAYRSEQASDGKVTPGWRQAFLAYPDRFTLGTDTFAPERWYYVEEHAKWTRQWLTDLPPGLAERIAVTNAEALADWALKKE